MADESDGQENLKRLTQLLSTRETGALTNRVDFRTRIQSRLLAELDPSLDATAPQFQEIAKELLAEILVEENIALSSADQKKLFDAIIAEIVGFGPLEPLLADDSIDAIMVNGPKTIYVERQGALTRTNVTFDDEEHLYRILDRMVVSAGKRLDESIPLMNGRLPGGFTVYSVGKSLSLSGPSLVIRRIPGAPLQIEDLIRFGTLTAEIAEFLRACVIARLNLLIVGGGRSGRTSLARVLAGFIPTDERVISIERLAGLQLKNEHILALESRQPNIEGIGEVSVSELVAYAESLMPDRIILDALQEGDASAYLDAFNQCSTLATISAPDIQSALYRVERGVMGRQPHLDTAAVREWITHSIDLVVEIKRFRDGTRKINQAAAVVVDDEGAYVLNTIFEFEQTTMDYGRIIGRIRPTGIRPSFMERVEDAGIHLPPTIFGIGSARY